MPNSFAIVTAVRNGWPRIQAAVNSVAAAATEAVNIRHIVRMHADTSDESGKWLRERSGIELGIESDDGMYDAIRRGFRDAREPYMGWLNSDEQYLPNALTSAAAVFESDPDADIVFGDYLLLDAQGEPVAARREIPARGWYLRHGVNYILSCATFFRREVWLGLGGFDDRYRLVADKDFYLRALASGFKFRHIPQYWGAYSMTGANLSRESAAIREQKELREQVGAYRLQAARALPRLVRRLEKLARGGYRRQKINTRLFDNNGRPREIEARPGTSWSWR